MRFNQSVAVTRLFSIAAVFLAAFATMASAQTDTVKVAVDATVAGTPFKHVWEYFGYDECNYTTDPEGVALLKTIASMFPGKAHIRSHFLLNSGNGVGSLKWGSTNVYTQDSAGNPQYNWQIIDGIMDTIVNTGCLPLVEIGFMPQALTTGTGAYKNSSTTALDGACFYPPNNYTKWGNLIGAWAGHLKSRYGAIDTSWLWELWNEPNIGYFKGTSADYGKMFDYAEAQLHGVFPNALLGGNDNAGAVDAFLQSFAAHCTTGTNAVTGQKGTRLDMILFHAKGGTAVVSNYVQMNMKNQLAQHQSGFNFAAATAAFKQKPIIIGEADPDGCAACPATSTPANAYRYGSAYGAYEVTMMKYTLDLASRIGVNLKGVLTWAWTFPGQPYFAGYRVLTTNGIHMPVLNIFKILGKLGPNRLTLTSTGAIPLDTALKSSIRGTNADIDGLAARSDSAVQVVVWNYHDNMVAAAPSHVQVKVSFPASFGSSVRMTHYRVNTTHSNSYTKWLALGKPQTPTADQLSQLTAAMQLQLFDSVRTMVLDDSHAALVFFDLPRYGISLLLFSPANTSGIRQGRGASNLPGSPIGLRVALQGISVGGGIHHIEVFDVDGRRLESFSGTGAHCYSLAGIRGKRALIVRAAVDGRTVVGRMVK